MPLSMTNPLKAADIHSMVTLKAGKVLLLRGHRRDELVIKVETNVQESTVKSSGYVVKALDKLAVAKALQPSEQRELLGYVRRLLEAERFYAEIDGGRQSPDYPNIRLACAAIEEPGGAITKMENLRVLDLNAALQQMCAQHVGTAHGRFVEALTEPGGLEMVGQIVVADLLTGNNDRFDFQYDMPIPKDFGPVTLNFKRLINVGNVMIAIDPSKEGKGSSGYRPVMLDYLDPGSMAMRLMRDPKVRMTEMDSQKWPARRILPDWQQRQKAAEDVAHDLLLCANPFGTNGGVFKHVEDLRVAAGMEEGLRKIIKHLHGRKVHPAIEDLLKLVQKTLK
ncbi:hypothetical protein ABXN37_09405 [Piscinibacter sakaiensis]|uniref:Uncharacterized protein n=1 Tax=Piscinibacter sakaiensis TaxID=1547922 RepID=A0A0K8NYB9_PISS1|nr:hypothetical protein [Piscinibacter sakaiensis]GAP35368.1 hypothetical protein ISF6_1139 [Piscinibacter sakaiensis]